MDRTVNININDTSPLANTAYVDSGKENKVYNKAQVNELVEDLREGTLGSVTPSQTLQQLNALPDGNYYASEAGPYAFGLTVPVGWQYRFSKVAAEWKVLTKVEMPMQDLSAIEKKVNDNETKVDTFIRDFSVTTDTEFNAESNNPIANSAVAPISDALKGFLNAPEGDYALNKTFKISEVSSYQNVYGVKNVNGLLKPNNTVGVFNESGVYMNTWLNIPLDLPSGQKITKIVAEMMPPGNPAGSINYIGMLGTKNDINTTLISNSDQSQSTIPITYEVNVSTYDTISMSFIVNDSNAETLKQNIKFHTQDGVVVDVKKYIDSKTSGSSHDNTYIDLIDFGCVGDGVTDDTAKINEAIQILINKGGGYIYLRDRTFKVTSIRIPNVINKWCRIGIKGAYAPTPRFGTIGDFDVTSFNGAMIISDLHDNTRGIINVESGSLYQNFNGLFLDVQNLNVRSYNNPQCHGINATNAVQLNVENVNIDTGVYNVHASEPTAITAGILTPKISNGAWTVLRNILVCGYYSGAYIYEHTLGDYLVFASNKIGLRFYKANHSSLFTRVGCYRNQKDVVVEDFHRFEIQQLAIELVGADQYDANNAWQRSLYNIEDIGNNGSGLIKYDVCLGNVGPVSTFTKNGGSLIKATQL